MERDTAFWREQAEKLAAALRAINSLPACHGETETARQVQDMRNTEHARMIAYKALAACAIALVQP